MPDIFLRRGPLATNDVVLTHELFGSFQFVLYPGAGNDIVLRPAPPLAKIVAAGAPPPITGTCGVTFAVAGLSATGELIFAGTIAEAFQVPALAASGDVVTAITGTCDVTFGVPGLTATGQVPVTESVNFGGGGLAASRRKPRRAKPPAISGVAAIGWRVPAIALRGTLTNPPIAPIAPADDDARDALDELSWLERETEEFVGALLLV